MALCHEFVCLITQNEYHISTLVLYFYHDTINYTFYINIYINISLTETFIYTKNKYFNCTRHCAYQLLLIKFILTCGFSKFSHKYVYSYFLCELWNKRQGLHSFNKKESLVIYATFYSFCCIPLLNQKHFDYRFVKGFWCLPSCSSWQVFFLILFLF